MVLICLALFISGFFFPPIWFALAGYCIYIFASRTTRRDNAVESRIKIVISSGKESISFKDLYYEAAKSYAVAKGAKAADKDSASARIIVEGRTYSVIFIRDVGGGTSIIARDSKIVDKEIEDDLYARISPQKTEPPALESKSSDDLGQLVAQGNIEAFKTLETRANSGEAVAQLEFGFAHAKGYCVQQDNKLALYWYEKAAEQGVLNAQFNIGCLHYLGQGCKRDVNEALRWFHIAAAGGHEVAKKKIEPMKMEASLAKDEHVLWQAQGINKAYGLVKYELAHKYLSELKDLASDPEVRDGLRMAASDGRFGLAKATEIQDAVTLIYNISSATPLAIEQVFQCAVNEDWQAFLQMPKS
ncbi:tetratricopeptide repeat protein [Pseudomonas fulva]|uniref:tetratricopeptide repeat protein n=1 Tax=Pseudomonas fulva TaxID=47880 RepID=UPI0034C646CB